MLRRAAAAWLSLALACPAPAAMVREPVPALPATPLAFAVPTVSPAAPPTAVETARTIAAAEPTPEVSRLHFDLAKPAAIPIDPVSAGTRGSAPQPVLQTSSPVPTAAKGPPPSGALPRRRPGAKTGAVVGLLAAASAPILYEAAPPLVLFYTLAVGTAFMLAGWAALGLARVGRRLLAARERPRRRLSRPRAFALGLALGLAAGAAPTVFSGPIIETLAGWTVPGREVRAVPPAFRDEALKALAGNPEGRRVLKELEDRGGTVRPPRFFLANLGDAKGFCLPLVDAVFLDPSLVTRRGWTVDEFLADPAKQRALAREEAGTVFHEFIHARQFRKSVQPGQLEDFPSQLFDYLTLENEYEAHLRERLYNHETLRRDPGAELLEGDLDDYRLFLADLDRYLATIDESSTYKGFVHADSPAHRRFMADLRARYPDLRAEGYELLSRRR